MASRRITQETFDAAVQENLKEFDMGPEEALQEAVEQFESQGVDLSNIVKKAPTMSGAGPQEPQHEILQILTALQESVAQARPGEVAVQLSAFWEQCQQDRACRFLAAEKGAYPALLAAWQLATGTPDLLLPALHALSVLIDGQPDLLDAQGLQLLVHTLARLAEADAEVPKVTSAALRCVRFACVKHEHNRRDLVEAGVLPLLTGALARHSSGTGACVVREACGALHSITCDDDVRTLYGLAGDHTRKIVEEHAGLKVLVHALQAFPNNLDLLSKLCGTLAHLTIRNNYCQEVVDLGGLALLETLLATCGDHQDLVRQVLNVLRAMACNDAVKDAIVRAGGTESIVAAMTRHLASPQVCERSCAALSVLALRRPEHCRAIMECGGIQAAVQAMKAHPQDASVQKQACVLIRNVMSRSPALAKPILELGVEELITQASATHPDCEDAAKAALRDLGCHVELLELWTGEKGQLEL
ncbi:armadillo repeat-containing protein 6 isoform X1 [Sorex araneus]|uniref:armadillo repeat-containing protein 6 isoform X1 n=1 Tax=Sorex araneus TaxID=42254 RepID=UPI00243350BC|nr:armadillo repeat-containing protein 6 isoform X1 [Sorex araneus]XP_054982143.1 armadillo repeat-containing protein 6 isoform X1 [Sorex araneus]